MAHLLVEVFGQAFNLAPALVEQIGQVLAVFSPEDSARCRRAAADPLGAPWR